MIAQITTASQGPSGITLAIGITFLIAFVVGVVIHFTRTGNPARVANPPPPAKPGRFNNPITGPILGIVLALIIVGLWLIFNFTAKSVFWGAVWVTLGGLWWHYGEVKHSPADPKQVGTIHIMGGMVTIPGTRWHKGIIVRGDVILFPFWPLSLTTVKTDVDSKEKAFEFPVTSSDNFTFTAKVNLIGKPDCTDMGDFIQAGNSMEEVYELIDTIAERSTRQLVSGATLKDILHGNANISGELETRIKQHFQSESFGVDLEKAQFIPIIDDNQKALLAGKAAEALEREKEVADHNTMTELAHKRQREHAQERWPVPFSTLSEADITAIVARLVSAGSIPTLEKCLETMHKERQIREKRSQHTTYEFVGNAPKHFIVNGGKP